MTEPDDCLYNIQGENMGFIKIEHPDDLEKLVNKSKELSKAVREKKITQEASNDLLWAYAKRIANERKEIDGR